MDISVQNALYHINTVEDAAALFNTAVGPLQLEDHLESFKLSVTKAPIDSTIDIIRLFLKNMEDEFLPLLGDPRPTYAGFWLNKLRGTSPPPVLLPKDLRFLQTLENVDNEQPA